MKKGRLINILLIIMLLIGLSLLLYPSFSDYWNSLHQSRAIASYTEQVANLEKEDYEELWNQATTYNEGLRGRSNSYILTEEQSKEYHALLNLANSGIMGHIEIPKINCSLPIYHGTEDTILQVAIGHLEWTSLPTGGENTHCVLSGHRGLPSARLFTDLDQLQEGDLFMLCVLNEVLTYEVDQILIVEPEDIDALHIKEGKDLCTLITCTPYGVNSHRLLVRGHRVENTPESENVRVTADAIQIEPMVVASIVVVPILGILLGILLFSDSRKQKKKIDV